MEFLRFGSSIPGSYWGCCAVCIIQNFKFDPDTKSSIEMSCGDSGTSLGVYAGPTYRDIFKTRIRTGTFSTTDMPDHGFLAVLTQDQISGSYGSKWLAILKEEGFEFIRNIDNSVYTGAGLSGSRSSHPNYLFGLFRNIGAGKVTDPFVPPKAWTDLPDPYQGDMSPSNMTKVQLAHWKEGVTKFLTEAEIVKAGAPVIKVGLRSKYPQQPKDQRDALQAKEKAAKPVTNSFPTKVAAVA